MIIVVTILTVSVMAFLAIGNGGRGEINAVNSTTSVLFSFRSGNVILIDQDLKFRSPERIDAKDNLLIVLRMGTYFWKIEDSIPEDVISLNVTEPMVGLKLKKYADGYDVINYNNASLNVAIYGQNGLTGKVILESSFSPDDEISDVVYVGGKDG